MRPCSSLGVRSSWRLVLIGITVVVKFIGRRDVNLILELLLILLLFDVIIMLKAFLFLNKVTAILSPRFLLIDLHQVSEVDAEIRDIKKELLVLVFDCTTSLFVTTCQSIG